MTDHLSAEKKQWNDTIELLGNFRVSWDDHWSFNFRNDPKRLAFVLSRYKFSAKMACNQARVLELGCSSGIGATILAEKAQSYTGVDLDLSALAAARKNLSYPKFTFIYEDFMGKFFGKFDAVISLDVVEHILPRHESLYFETVVNNLDTDGICIIGTPNITSSPYASECSRRGHVNLFSQERLISCLKRHFYQVFPFGMNDEVVHTGYASMAHYLFCLGCHKKQCKK